MGLIWAGRGLVGLIGDGRGLVGLIGMVIRGWWRINSGRRGLVD